MLGEFSQHKMKIALPVIQQPACNQNIPTKSVVWTFRAQSTAPPLLSSLFETIMAT